ncbi:deubiquitinase OTUD6B-like isoform X3 [Hylaeus volcanicus]|uniref:deubiquitinase OTUD6B-like isoform X3 n=1 Tax=Hylaeus volcanicus TaxID=313075 RepID=UPI0023B82E38|nr:deubiquitinase OTUD6B-like isoform X3 [Hylaeus volcanicus]XP_053990835.1 deubiquitinase OTUD6B-like isoform X3 [Hylaeus volcanicus]XP_053990836.1 deubiquitinase OTUD6B-like isoform X3 [Hylaeus volcanicus]XP_053990837.1 deubiquitinase OTUD6B-like isoform X3 [Hylaeus volcanicus]
MNLEEPALPRSNRAISRDYLSKIKQLETAHKQCVKKCTTKLERSQLIDKHKKEIQVLKNAMDIELKRKCCDVSSNPSTLEESNNKQSETCQKTSDALQVLHPENEAPLFYKSKNILTEKKKKKLEKQLAKSNSIIVSGKSLSDGLTSRQAEAEKLGEIIKQDGLRIYSIAADGHCMFRAIEHQLKLNFSEKLWDYKTLRTKVTEYLRENKTTLLPFFFDSSDNANEYDVHCNGISKDTWGGELELRALVNILKYSIHIYSVSPPYKLVYTPDQDNDSPKSNTILRLSFHKHEYNSGPHYHSLVPL